MSNQQKMCPILTAAALVNYKPSAIVTPGLPAQEPEGHACQGPQCAFFVPLADEQGQVLGGNCAIPLLTITANNGIGMVAGVAGAAGLLPKAKPGPKLSSVPNDPKKPH